jgi:lipoate-protein ligase A
VPGAALLLTTRISSTTPVDAKSTIAARMESRSLYVGKTTEMRLPRQDTPLSLPAEQPSEGIRRDEALVEHIQPGGPPLVRWWLAASPAVVVGLGMRRRLASLVDVERCRAAGVDILERRAGGGALLLDQHMLCGAVCVPIASVPSDVTESYRWLGDELVLRLRALGFSGARRVDVEDARADVAAIRTRDDPVARVIGSTCYGVLSPHEVVVGAKKLVGLAQVRRRHAALFQIGILLHDQAPLADLLRAPDDQTRAEERKAFARDLAIVADVLARS